MPIKENIKQFFIEKKAVYGSSVDDMSRSDLNKDFALFIEQQFIEGGLNPKGLSKTYRLLSRFFHPDRRFTDTQEGSWLSSNLSKDKDAGLFFKLANAEHQVLKKRFKEIHTALKPLLYHYCINSEKIILDQATLLSFDRDFEGLVKQWLLTDGPQHEAISERYRQLAMYFRTDIPPSMPEIFWIENNFSQGKNDGACLKRITVWYEQLTCPEKFKERKFEDIKNIEEYRIWLVHLRDKASTSNAQNFYTSLIDLFDQSARFFNEAGQIQPKALGLLIKFIPLVLSTFGAILIAEELFIIYVFYFLLLKGGQTLGKKDSEELRAVGVTLQKLGIITATTTTTLMIRLLEMTFWVSNRCLDMSLQASSSIMSYLSMGSSSEHQVEEDPIENLHKELSLASDHRIGGIPFKTPELKVIAAPLELYLMSNKGQIGLYWRPGYEKVQAVKAFIFNMQSLDRLSGPTEAKLEKAKEYLELMKKKPEVYSSSAATAINKAEQIIILLNDYLPRMKKNDTWSECSTSETPLIMYQP